MLLVDIVPDGLYIYIMEIWKDIEGFEGVYQISNLGRVKSLHFNKTLYLRYSNDECGYKKVNLFIKGIQKTITIHRLVASHFLNNKYNKRTINHLDGNKSNNKVINLEWATYSENIQHAYDNKLKCGSKGINNASSKKVLKYTKGNKFIKLYMSVSEASKDNNINCGGISLVCNGINKTSGGFIWKFYVP